MSTPLLETPKTAPEDKVPLFTKLAYASGGTTDVLGHWLYNGLALLVFNTYLGLSPGLVTSALGLTRLVDAFTDPLFGWLSDNTRSRWGRRRPYIFIGSLLAGICLPLLFAASANWDASAPWYENHLFWFMVASASLYAPIISSYNMPYHSLGAELTPDYHERTSVMSWKAMVLKITGSVISGGGWFVTRDWWIDPVTGKLDILEGAMWAAAIAGAIMIATGMLNVFCVKERYYHMASRQERTHFLAVYKSTFRCKPYLVLLGAALVYAIPTGLAGTLGYYVGTFHVMQGDLPRAQLYGFWGGITFTVFGMLGVPAASWLARRLGKRRALYCTLGMGIIASASSWWMASPSYPWLFVFNSGLNGFAATGLWVVLPSMLIDVLDYDELQCGKRQEGAYSSCFSWVTKVGASLAIFISGHLAEALGFVTDKGAEQAEGVLFWMRVNYALIPVLAMVICWLFIRWYPLHQTRMREIRSALEARRGKV